MNARVVLGLDLSVRALGLCAVESTWDLRWDRTRACTLEVPLTADEIGRAHTLRLMALARDVRVFAVRVGATDVWAEDIGFFDRTRIKSAIQLAELRSAVRVELERECGLTLRFVQSSSARKLLYGVQPPKGLSYGQRKAWLLEPLRLAGAPFEDDAQGDAFCVANYALSELGAPCLAHILGTPELKPKAKRMRKVAA